jgi:hypothetical protein
MAQTVHFLPAGPETCNCGSAAQRQHEVPKINATKGMSTTRIRRLHPLPYSYKARLPLRPQAGSVAVNPTPIIVQHPQQSPSPSLLPISYTTPSPLSLLGARGGLDLSVSRSRHDGGDAAHLLVAVLV